MALSPGQGGLRNPVAWGAFALVALGVPALALFQQEEVPPPPPVLGSLPEFALTNQAGVVVDRAALRGSTVVLDFIFTRCPDICPTLTAQMKAVGDSLGPRPFGGPPLRRVSITVDPDFDTPSVLDGYASGYEADVGTWDFLTGPAQDIDVLVLGLSQMVERQASADGAPPNIAHSQRLLLIDTEGQLRGFHSIDEAGLAALVQDVEALAAGK